MASLGVRWRQARDVARSLATLPALQRDLELAIADLGAAREAIATTRSLSTTHGYYLGDHRAVVNTTWGRRLLVRTDDVIVAPELLITGQYESGLTALFPRLLGPGDTFVDVGANIGYYSVLAASIVGEHGCVVAFEPHPDVAALTQLNLIFNGMAHSSHVAVHAAYSHVDQLQFFARAHAAANSSLGAIPDGELDAIGDTQTAIQVSAVDIDGYLVDTLGIDVSQIRLVKVDVEGAELFALQGARKLLAANRARVVVEWCPGQQVRTGASPTDLISLIDDLAHAVWLIDASSGELSAIEPAALATIDYANVLLVPEGMSVTNA